MRHGIYGDDCGQNDRPVQTERIILRFSFSTPSSENRKFLARLRCDLVLLNDDRGNLISNVTLIA